MAADAQVKSKSKSKDSKKDKDKRDKKDKKRSETDGVTKVKKDKKEKKLDNEKLREKVAASLHDQLQADVAASAKIGVDDDHSGSERGESKKTEAQTQLVYFAVPLADAKAHKKIYKTIKKARKAGALQRGVKEVNKALRKTEPKTPASADRVPGVCVIAGDISPDEVIMHLPVYCEEHNVPYLFVRSRLELGGAAKTKRPTSVVFIQEKGKEVRARNNSKAADEEDEDDDGSSYADAYKDLLKLAQREAEKQLRAVMAG